MRVTPHVAQNIASAAEARLMAAPPDMLGML